MTNNTIKQRQKRDTLTITLSEQAIDALTVLTSLDMRSKSHEIEYLIFDAIDRRGVKLNSQHCNRREERNDAKQNDSETVNEWENAL